MSPYVPPVLEMTVPGDPLPKERPRMAGGRAYTTSKTTTAENIIATAARAAGVVATDKPVRLYVHARRRHWTRVDLDNLVKLVQDALNGVAYTDDQQIFEMHATKQIGQGDDCSTYVRVEVLPEDSHLGPFAKPAKRQRKKV